MSPTQIPSSVSHSSISDYSYKNAVFPFFQYCASLRKPLATINLVMASFSEGYYNHSSTVMKFANSIIGGSKYMMDPELRAQRVSFNI